MIYQAEQRLHEARMSPMPSPGAMSVMAPTETPSYSIPAAGAVTTSTTTTTTTGAATATTTITTVTPVATSVSDNQTVTATATATPVTKEEAADDDTTKTKEMSKTTTTITTTVVEDVREKAIEPVDSGTNITHDDFLTVKDNKEPSTEWPSSSSSSTSSLSPSSSTSISSVSSSATTARCGSSIIDINTEEASNESAATIAETEKQQECAAIDKSTSESTLKSESPTKDTMATVPTDHVTPAAVDDSSTSPSPVKGGSEQDPIIIKKKDDASKSDDEEDFESLGKPRRVPLTSVNPHITCNLCHGYLIDATTIVECLHSFCHSCIMQHLSTERYCPQCEMMINTAKPNIKPDTTLQAIVYKLVPGLYEKELMRKRAFYKTRPEAAALATPEQRGEDTEHLIFVPTEYISLSLEYADIDEHVLPDDEIKYQLLQPKFLQCPAVFTIGHLKKFVYGKYDIDTSQFSIDIMYKVKTIVLLDHYTLMDVAYIYIWKRDTPMRFYFRVKERPKRIAARAKLIPRIILKKAVIPTQNLTISLPPQGMTVANNISKPSPKNGLLKTISEIKEPKVVENCPEETEAQKTSKLKITLVSKPSKQSKSLPSPNNETPGKSSHKSHRHKDGSGSPPEKDERKVENIKLKIDLSKQNSVTIINMSDPERKEIVKPVKPEKEWKVKNKKDKTNNAKSLKECKKGMSNPPLTVPPLTIKAERIGASSPRQLKSPVEDPQSKFLKSFALTPKKDAKSPIKPEKKLEPITLLLAPVTQSSPPMPSTPATTLMGPPQNLPTKRKSKDTPKNLLKKPKCVFAPTLTPEDFKTKALPPPPSAEQKNDTPPSLEEPGKSNGKSESEKADEKLMPPPPPTITIGFPTLPIPPTKIQLSTLPAPPPKNGIKPPSNELPMKPPSSNNKTPVKFAPPGSLTPHPMSTPTKPSAGNRTPIPKRFQPILPKGRPNPFANIPTDVNKILKDAGTEIKSITTTDGQKKKIYGPKTTTMGPPAATATKTASTNTIMSTVKPANNISNYLNFALYNATKSRGNEAPPGCRTPMYTPNSPIYSPSSPQYVPNYNIPTQPTYKYTPKPNASSNYLQNVLNASNSHLSSLFPSPPTKQNENGEVNRSSPPQMQLSPPKPDEKTATSILEQCLKRPYPFRKSPSPSSIEDPPEKQLKVKSLLNSCNINIPSSLSITITREDSESATSSSTHPKHKSPVNNYIEILKLPDQPAPPVDDNKRLPQPMKPQNQNQNQNQPQPQQKMNPNQNHSPNQQVVTSVTIQSVMTSRPQSTVRSSTPTKTTTTPAMTIQPATKQIPPLNPIDRKQKSASSSPVENKKTPSPEKRSPSSASNSTEKKQTNGDSTSPKSSSDGPPSKKFRHILPRTLPHQRPMDLANALFSNGIPSLTSPLAQKQQTPKKVPLKKSPTPPHTGFPQINGNAAKKSPPTNNNNSAMKSPPCVVPTTPNSNNNVVNSKSKQSPPMNPQPSQENHIQKPIQNGILPPPMGAHPQILQQSSPSSQADLNKFLNDTIFRAKAQAVAAMTNQPPTNLPTNLAPANVYYPSYQPAQFSPVYGYPQAFIMEHFTRMRRASNEALEQFIQKVQHNQELKALTDAPAVTLNTPKSPIPTKSPTMTFSPESKTPTKQNG